MYDTAARIGGMNHFLLPEEQGAEQMVSMRFGAYAMELLVNGLMRAGARRERLQVKLFGGGCLSDGLTDIGARNASFAEEFLAREGLEFAGGSLRGRHARRVQFWPTTGRARQLALPIGIDVALDLERRVPHVSRDQGNVELFGASK